MTMIDIGPQADCFLCKYFAKKIYYVQTMHKPVENGATRTKHKKVQVMPTNKNPLKHTLTLDETMFNRPLRII